MRLLITGGSGFIGTNLVEKYLKEGIDLVNVDWQPPLDPAHTPYWKNVDIMDRLALHQAFQEFRPTHVVHLAARTDTEEDLLEVYLQNHEGTRILLQVVKECPTVQHIIITSTQFVCEAGYQPAHDQDFKPFTVYGESKRLTELITRKAELECAWTIIRPTTIWGPWSLRYRDVMFRVMRKGLYFHPGRGRVIRSYGYVGNVVWQISRMLEVPRDVVDGRVFYVGDRPIDLKLWVDAVSRELIGKPVRFIPTFIVRSAALFGDTLKFLGLPFPITTGRFRSMTSDYITPMDATIAALGEAPFDLSSSVKATVRWYDEISHRIKAPEARVAIRTSTVGDE